MVVFGLFGYENKRSKSKDVLDELMGLEDASGNCYMKHDINREYESMEIIKSTIALLHEQIEFLREELRKKNLLIKMLNFRNANKGDKKNIT